MSRGFLYCIYPKDKKHIIYSFHVQELVEDDCVSQALSHNIQLFFSSMFHIV